MDRRERRDPRGGRGWSPRSQETGGHQPVPPPPGFGGYVPPSHDMGAAPALTPVQQAIRNIEIESADRQRQQRNLADTFDMSGLSLRSQSSWPIPPEDTGVYGAHGATRSVTFPRIGGTGTHTGFFGASSDSGHEGPSLLTSDWSYRQPTPGVPHTGAEAAMFRPDRAAERSDASDIVQVHELSAGTEFAQQASLDAPEQVEGVYLETGGRKEPVTSPAEGPATPAVQRQEELDEKPLPAPAVEVDQPALLTEDDSAVKGKRPAETVSEVGEPESSLLTEDEFDRTELRNAVAESKRLAGTEYSLVSRRRHTGTSAVTKDTEKAPDLNPFEALQAQEADQGKADDEDSDNDPAASQQSLSTKTPRKRGKKGKKPSAQATRRPADEVDDEGWAVRVLSQVTVAASDTEEISGSDARKDREIRTDSANPSSQRQTAGALTGVVAHRPRSTELSQPSTASLQSIRDTIGRLEGAQVTRGSSHATTSASRGDSATAPSARMS